MSVCARIFAAALMAGAIVVALAFPAFVGEQPSTPHALTAPPSTARQTVRVPASARVAGAERGAAAARRRERTRLDSSASLAAARVSQPSSPSADGLHPSDFSHSPGPAPPTGTAAPSPPKKADEPTPVATPPAPQPTSPPPTPQPQEQTRELAAVPSPTATPAPAVTPPPAAVTPPSEPPVVDTGGGCDDEQGDEGNGHGHGRGHAYGHDKDHGANGSSDHDGNDNAYGDDD
jgi:hypothetical protein